VGSLSGPPEKFVINGQQFKEKEHRYFLKYRKDYSATICSENYYPFYEIKNVMILAWITFFFFFFFDGLGSVACSHSEFRNFESHRQLVRPLGRVISPSQGRYLHIHASSGIRTRDLNV
jgi:hypothetical protein